MKRRETRKGEQGPFTLAVEMEPGEYSLCTHPATEVIRKVPAGILNDMARGGEKVIVIPMIPKGATVDIRVTDGRCRWVCRPSVKPVSPARPHPSGA